MGELYLTVAFVTTMFVAQLQPFNGLLVGIVEFVSDNLITVCMAVLFFVFAQTIAYLRARRQAELNARFVQLIKKIRRRGR